MGGYAPQGLFGGAGGGFTKGGLASFSGNGSQTVFNIAHGLSTTPEVPVVIPASSDAMGSYNVDKDATNIIVTFATAPPGGSSNIRFQWGAAYTQTATQGFTSGSLTTLTNKTIGDKLGFIKVSIPADPTTEEGIVYLKQIDASNNGLFMKLKKGGAIVEVQIL
jgi:hypothetical protein